MAATVNVALPTTNVWVEAATTGSGLVTNTSNLALQMAIAASTPALTFTGHRVNSHESLGFSLAAGLQLYLKAEQSAFQANITVALTPDDPPA